MSLYASKLSKYTGQVDDGRLQDYLNMVDIDLTNLFNASSIFHQFGTGTNYSILTYTSTNYVWFPTVGSWNITSELLYAGTGATYIGLKPGTGIWLGDETFGSAPFSVDPNGQLIAHAGRIGGWYIGTTTLSSTNLILDSSNEVIQNSSFVSGALGSGFRVQPDVSEFQNIRVRGKLTNAVFERDVISSVGGSLLVSDSDILNADMTAADNSNLVIVGDTTFAVGDILRIKDGVDDEWLSVTAVSATTYTVTRDRKADYGAGANPAWKKGTAVVNYGASGEGLIFMTASDTNAPHINILTHAGSPWATTTTTVRIGNLNGFLGYATDLYGIAIGNTNRYLKYDPTNGLQISGTMTASTIYGTTMSASFINTSTLSAITVSASQINTCTLTSISIKTSTLSAITISACAINTSTLSAVTISASSIVTCTLSSITITTCTLSALTISACNMFTSTLTAVSIKSANYVATTTGYAIDETNGVEVNTGAIRGKLINDALGLAGFTNYGGDGSDGDVTIISNTDFSNSVMQFADLTISATTTLTLANCIIGVSGTLTVYGTISAASSGYAGGAQRAGAGSGYDGTSASSDYQGFSAGGGGGGGGGYSSYIGGIGGTAGGTGGSAGAAPPTDGGAGSAASAKKQSFVKKALKNLIILCKGAGGGSGSGYSGQFGGAGGAGGGFLLVECVSFDGESGSVLSANGGNGVDGSGNNAGGGGGGGGGVLILRYKNLIANSGTISATGGVHGNGGASAASGGNGGDGVTSVEHIV